MRSCVCIFTVLKECGLDGVASHKLYNAIIKFIKTIALYQRTSSNYKTELRKLNI